MLHTSAHLNGFPPQQLSLEHSVFHLPAHGLLVTKHIRLHLRTPSGVFQGQAVTNPPQLKALAAVLFFVKAQLLKNQFTLAFTVLFVHLPKEAKNGFLVSTWVSSAHVSGSIFRVHEETVYIHVSVHPEQY